MHVPLQLACPQTWALGRNYIPCCGRRGGGTADTWHVPAPQSAPTRADAGPGDVSWCLLAWLSIAVHLGAIPPARVWPWAPDHRYQVVIFVQPGVPALAYVVGLLGAQGPPEHLAAARHHAQQSVEGCPLHACLVHDASHDTWSSRCVSEDSARRRSHAGTSGKRAGLHSHGPAC